MISDYTELKSEIARWLDRDDLTADIPGFIQLAEAEIQRVLRRTSKRQTITISEETTSLPTTVAELRSIHLVTSSVSLDKPISIVTPEMLAEVRARNMVAGRPRFASIIGSNIVVSPAPDDVYAAEIVYFEKLTPLSDTQTINTVLTEAPDAYLFGSLAQAAAFLEHDERLPVWETKFNRALAQLETVREREEFNASLRPARLPVVFR